MDETNAVAPQSEDKQQTETRDQAPLTPLVDVFEDSSGITLCADLPGVPKDKLTLQVKDDTLTIQGVISIETPQGMEAIYAEVNSPRYERAFTLSKELDAEKVTAEFEAGVLKLRIPKAEHAQPRRIEIKVA
ncbi:Hsp20/alpha crystallin family protein [Candidimonas sp. SYP-B2681]|uniref:Hsp20/alpha crystallin family protein n=1 Tax=Candidimonas sp. SYP-B2681 TaxID=2497686 RepID=UPI000F891ED3|nr:Hsp20/alpha crystallin family protein [Candidimonas sp. SYP-B2681]RTZ41640.1 Hsp20/alpha crystallin family protein [Candidimonas sp. SYP-B2681]